MIPTSDNDERIRKLLFSGMKIPKDADILDLGETNHQ